MRPDSWIDCAHCGEPLNKLFDFAEPCPGCGVLVCWACHEQRQVFAAQTCRPQHPRGNSSSSEQQP